MIEAFLSIVVLVLGICAVTIGGSLAVVMWLDGKDNK